MEGGDDNDDDDDDFKVTDVADDKVWDDVSIDVADNDGGDDDDWVKDSFFIPPLVSRNCCGWGGDCNDDDDGGGGDDDGVSVGCDEVEESRGVPSNVEAGDPIGGQEGGCGSLLLQSGPQRVFRAAAHLWV